VSTYLTIATFRLLSGTTYSDAIVQAIIDEGEKEIDQWLASAEITGVAGGSTLQNASAQMASVWLYMRMLLEGKRLKALAVLGLNQGDDPQGSIKMFRQEAKDLVEQFIAEQNNADENSGSSFETTIVRQDHEMPATNLDQSKIPEYHDRADETGNQDGTEV